ncbi:MAG: HAMP domain-containing histidine kinase [Pseudomonadales bacterium]|nr:HAMP domain-containing histidine kinase [Pseudomonadales bacterium]
MNRGLRARLGRLFAVQLAVIGLATVIGIYITQLVVEDLLTRQALDLEAEHFWTRYDADPGTALPDTANMRGYLTRPGVRPPIGLEDVAAGFSRIDFEGRSRVVHVSENAGARLVLVFDSAQVSDLAFYFGILPLSIVLLLIYALLFVAYRWSQAALSPIIRLARRLEAVDFMRPGGIHLDLADLAHSADAEVATMIDALGSFTARLDAAIERERVFTRDAGHELRTPVAVFKGSLDLLERDRSRPSADRKALARMRRTVADMESLLETLLLLARVEAEPVHGETTSVNQVASEEIDALRELTEAHRNRVELTTAADRDVRAPKQIVRIVVGNVLKNAVSFTREGKVDVHIHAGGMTVTDTGIGMSSEELGNAFEAFYRADAARGVTPGHGLGLAIVGRIVKRYGWTIRARSRSGEGTTVDLGF